mmetsp:Transcript_120978/g.233462  ORF Transcript_120978/g.233462 Transcript_120978/m.233462 type:complete len:240 (-) Transcript_120978:63-782(-)
MLQGMLSSHRLPILGPSVEPRWKVHKQTCNLLAQVQDISAAIEVVLAVPTIFTSAMLTADPSYWPTEEASQQVCMGPATKLDVIAGGPGAGTAAALVKLLPDSVAEDREDTAQAAFVRLPPPSSANEYSIPSQSSVQTEYFCLDTDDERPPAPGLLDRTSEFLKYALSWNSVSTKWNGRVVAAFVITFLMVILYVALGTGRGAASAAQGSFLAPPVAAPARAMQSNSSAISELTRNISQ